MADVDEAELFGAFQEGRALDCAVDGRQGRVDAAILRRCVMKGEVDPHGLGLRNAMIAGTLDLAGFEVPFPLRFEACAFEQPLSWWRAPGSTGWRLLAARSCLACSVTGSGSAVILTCRGPA